MRLIQQEGDSNNKRNNIAVPHKLASITTLAMPSASPPYNQNHLTYFKATETSKLPKVLLSSTWRINWRLKFLLRKSVAHPVHKH